ncbi:LeoA/HP0731 family dynamin-like GTPase [Pseudomonas aeruginosa]
MEQFKQFNIEKQAAIDTLENLHEVVVELGKVGIDVGDDLQKIASALQSVRSDVLRVALLGAFSDGKTSVIAAWLGKVMDDMKIDMDESSDRLAIYKPEGLPDKCEIVDTPGLFGDKEKTIDGEQVMYEDVTKRYISEAHLVLYVVDATNPLKDSHTDIVRWVLRDLNKLTSTVFVINKMDEVTDLTEQALFQEQAVIKKDNLKAKLQRAANLSPDEMARLNICCIASNPNGRGLNFWFGKPEQYESRSRINDLKAVTGQILKTNVPEVLIAKTGLDVVRDLVGQRVAYAEGQLMELDVFAKQNEQESARIRDDISQGRREVKRLAGEAFNELRGLESRLLGRLRPLALEDIRGFLDDEIGYSEQGAGYILHGQIKTVIDRFFDMSSAVTSRLSRDIGSQLNSSESFVSSMGQGALKSLGGAAKSLAGVSPEAIKATIFVARDTLGKLTGYVYKFKPWEATKLAGNISKWAGPAGAAFTLGADLYGAYKERELEQELLQTKASIAELIKDAFKDIYDVLGNDERVFEFFAPQIKQFEKIVAEIDGKSDEIRASRERVRLVQQKLKALELPGTVARPALASV